MTTRAASSCSESNGARRPWDKEEMLAAAHAGKVMSLAKWLCWQQLDPGPWPATYWEQSLKAGSVSEGAWCERALSSGGAARARCRAEGTWGA